MTPRRAWIVPLLLALLAACTPRLAPPGELTVPPALVVDPTGATGLTGAGLRMADGAVLPLRVWRTDGPPRAAVLALHGFNDHSRFIADAARALNGHGVAVYAYDQRGFGGAPHRGLWPGWEALAADVAVAARLVRGDLPPGTPLVLLGESMGGAVALAATTDPAVAPPAVDALVLSAPAVWGRATMPFYQRAGLWLAAHLTPALKATGRDLGIQASDNIAMLRALGRDPLIIKATRFDTLWGLANLMDRALAAAPRVGRNPPLPVLILYGEKDEVIPRGPTRQFLAALPDPPPAPRAVALYADGWHMLMRDLQAPVVIGDIAAWIADPARPLPSGAGGRPWRRLTD